MTVIQSVFLGIIQGLTEFLPVSSSGHLAILENIFSIETDGGMLFDIMLHIGTLVAIFVAYHRDIWKMLREAFFMILDVFSNLHIWALNKIHKTSLKYKKIVHNSYRKFVILILVSTAPTAVIGYLARGLVSAAGSTLLIPGICLLITAVLLLMADTVHDGKKMPRDILYREGLIIGLAQGCATLPGLSRSGTTIAACLLCGMDRRFAVKYSFLLSVPAVLGAAVLELRDVIAEPIESSQIAIYLVGTAFAAIVGYVCIKTMLVVVRKKKFIYFSGYCALVGALAIAAHFFL